MFPSSVTVFSASGAMISLQVSFLHSKTRPGYLSKIVLLWVTITIAVPRTLFIFDRSSMMPSAVSLSRFPVGSSASITSGLFSSALAIATLCCSPPDSW